MAGVLSGMGGRVIVYGGLQDICMTDSSQWPVMSVTSWRVMSSVEVADSVSEVDEDSSPSSVVEVGFEGPEIVLTIVVTIFVLVRLADASEVPSVVIVLTKVVTTSLLDRLLCVPETVIVEVLFA